MKVIYITLENLSLHKGSVVHIKEIVEGLRRRGHQVEVIGSSHHLFEKIGHFGGLSFQTLFFSRFLGMKRQPYILSSLFLFFYLFRILPRYDVIYARDYHTALIALLPRLLHHKKLVYEINGIASEEQGLKGDSTLNRMLVLTIQEAEKLATKFSDKIISVTPYMASYLIDRYHCQADKIEIVSNGVNLKKFLSIEDKPLLRSYRERLGISSEEFVILFLGNLNLTQGVEDLIQVVPSLVKEINLIKFLIVGDGVLKDELKKKVDRLGVSKHFIFTGMVDYDEVPIYVNLSDICVLLKRKLKSGWSPIKLFEYLACGKPVIASRVEGLEFIEAEGAGRLVEPGDLGGLKEALLELLEDSQKRTEMGRKGLQLVRERFSWDTGTLKVEKILHRLA